MKVFTTERITQTIKIAILILCMQGILHYHLSLFYCGLALLAFEIIFLNKNLNFIDQAIFNAIFSLCTCLAFGLAVWGMAFEKNITTGLMPLTLACGYWLATTVAALGVRGVITLVTLKLKAKEHNNA